MVPWLGKIKNTFELFREMFLVMSRHLLNWKHVKQNFLKVSYVAVEGLNAESLFLLKDRYELKISNKNCKTFYGINHI